MRACTAYDGCSSSISVNVRANLENYLMVGTPLSTLTVIDSRSAYIGYLWREIRYPRYSDAALDIPFRGNRWKVVLLALEVLQWMTHFIRIP